LNYKEYGTDNKDVIILLHGGGLSWWNYREVAEMLQADYHVILPILDGHAGSDRDFTTIEENAAEIVGFVETYKKTEWFMDKSVYGIEEIPADCDYIVVANTYVNEIYKECNKRNIDTDRFIFLKGAKTQLGCAKIELIREILGEKNYTNYCAEFDNKLIKISKELLNSIKENRNFSDF